MVVALVTTEIQMIVSLNAVLTAFLISTAIGIGFGFLPARNAARLDPVDALARE
jgi:macrolide transport system ATP-binding/permease protein